MQKRRFDPQLRRFTGQFRTLDPFDSLKRLFESPAGAFDKTLLDSERAPLAFGIATQHRDRSPEPVDSAPPRLRGARVPVHKAW